MLTTLFVLANAMIAAAYIGIGLWLAPTFDIERSDVLGNLARGFALIFFITCALTHIELLAHVADTTWKEKWHAVLIHVPQAIAGLGFLSLGMKALRVRIGSKH